MVRWVSVGALNRAPMMPRDAVRLITVIFPYWAYSSQLVWEYRHIYIYMYEIQMFIDQNKMQFHISLKVIQYTHKLIYIYSSTLK